ncbi:hypothetical protein C0992_007429, partial [Termitomyces sp. T32_za158]
MSLDIFREVDNERLERLRLYRTPAAIPQWDGWRELTEEDHYRLMFKRAEESMAVTTCLRDTTPTPCASS